MVDNVTADPGSGGATFRTDDDGTAHWPYTKLAFGADNTQTIVSTSDPVPAQIHDGTDALAVLVEDAASAGGETGIQILGVRRDADTTPVSLDGDFHPLVFDANGYLKVEIHDGGGSHTIDGTVTANAGTGTFTIQEAAAMDVSAATVTVDLGANNDVTINGSSVVFVDDTATHTAATTEVVGIGAVAVPTDTTVDANDIAMPGMSTDRRMWTDTQIVGQDAALDVSAATVTVTGTVTANAGTGTLSVDLGANNDVTVASAIAHDAAASGQNPVIAAARATNSIEGLTQVAAADSSYITSDLNGCLVTRPHTTLEETLSERVSNTNGTSTDFTTFAAGGAGVHNYVTTITIYNSSATDGYVDFRDGSAGSIIFTAPAPATSGSVINLPVPLKGAANTALAYDVSGALSTVYISVVGFQAQG